MSSADGGFLSRWSRRKVQARQGSAPEPGPPAPVIPAVVVTVSPAASAATPVVALTPASVDETAAAAAPPQANEPPPTLADVAALTRESDFSRFVAPGVDREVKNGALKKLFTDPHFNVMDGLDVYIDDYNKPDPLPTAMVRQLAQAAFLGLIEAEPAPAVVAGGGTPAVAAKADVPATGRDDLPKPDEDPDLRLQPHDAAGCGGAEDGAAADGQR